MWLVNAHMTIGSDEQNSIRLRQESVQPFHAEMRLKDGNVYLINKHPEYRTGLNGKKVRKAVIVKPDDVIVIGTVKIKLLRAADAGSDAKPFSSAEATSPNLQKQSGQSVRQGQALWGLRTNASWAKQPLYPIHGVAIVGRDEAADIAVPVSHLSRQHAQLQVAGQFLLVKDLGSTNGTFLNGERITQGRARPGDKLKFDVVTFVVEGPDDDHGKTVIRPIPAVVSNLSKEKSRSASASTPREEAGQQPSNASAHPVPPAAERPHDINFDAVVSDREPIADLAPEKKRSPALFIAIIMLTLAVIATVLLFTDAVDIEQLGALSQSFEALVGTSTVDSGRSVLA
ncbi:hypothetical protein GCM10022278_21870 [Allohahella marinimesophila]|uniref:FHA domain-containing protein n=1 Tax=Allohahella marinimesophila TaxID=1054972 RepID=A0ABP7PDD3_9GAMM